MSRRSVVTSLILACAALILGILLPRAVRACRYGWGPAFETDPWWLARSTVRHASGFMDMLAEGCTDIDLPRRGAVADALVAFARSEYWPADVMAKSVCPRSDLSGRPLRYIVGPDGVIVVYSVGKNGLDEFGEGDDVSARSGFPVTTTMDGKGAAPSRAWWARHAVRSGCEYINFLNGSYCDIKLPRTGTVSAAEALIASRYREHWLCHDCRKSPTKDVWGRPLRYVIESDGTVLVYSTGENGKDENGGGDDICARSRFPLPQTREGDARADGRD